MARNVLKAAESAMQTVEHLISGAKAPYYAPRECSVHIRVSVEELGRLKAQAAARGLTVSAYVMLLVHRDSGTGSNSSAKAAAE